MTWPNLAALRNDLVTRDRTSVALVDECLYPDRRGRLAGWAPYWR